jgi:hypothetical protein
MKVSTAKRLRTHVSLPSIDQLGSNITSPFTQSHSLQSTSNSKPLPPLEKLEGMGSGSTPHSAIIAARGSDATDSTRLAMKGLYKSGEENKIEKKIGNIVKSIPQPLPKFNTNAGGVEINSKTNNLIDPRLKLISIQPNSTAIFRAQLQPPTPIAMLSDKSNLPRSSLSQHNDLTLLVNSIATPAQRNQVNNTSRLQRSHSIPNPVPRYNNIQRSQSALVTSMSRVELADEHGKKGNNRSAAGNKIGRKSSIKVFRDSPEVKTKGSKISGIIIDNTTVAVDKSNDIAPGGYPSHRLLYSSSTPVDRESDDMAMPIEGEMIHVWSKEMDSSMVLETYDSPSSSTDTAHVNGTTQGCMAEDGPVEDQSEVMDMNQIDQDYGGGEDDGRAKCATYSEPVLSDSPPPVVDSSDHYSTSPSPSPRNRPRVADVAIDPVSHSPSMKSLSPSLAGDESDIAPARSTSELPAVNPTVDCWIDNAHPLPPRHQPHPIDDELTHGPPSSEDDLAYAIRTQFGFSDYNGQHLKRAESISDDEVQAAGLDGCRRQIMREPLICEDEDASDDELMIG